MATAEDIKKAAALIAGEGTGKTETLEKALPAFMDKKGEEDDEKGKKKGKKDDLEKAKDCDDEEEDKKGKDLEKSLSVSSEQLEGLALSSAQKAFALGVVEGARMASAAIEERFTSLEKSLSSQDDKLDGIFTYSAAAVQVIKDFKAVAEHQTELTKAVAVEVEAIGNAPSARKSASGNEVELEKSLGTAAPKIELSSLEPFIARGTDPASKLGILRAVRRGDYSSLSHEAKKSLGVS